MTDRIAELRRPAMSMIIPTPEPAMKASSASSICFTGWGCAIAVGFVHAQSLTLLAVGASVARLVVAGRLPRPDAVCLISLFSMLFLYHRDYDTVILALPLVRCAGGVRATVGRSRRLYAACGLILIAVLYMNAAHLTDVDRLVSRLGCPRASRAGGDPTLRHLVDPFGDVPHGPRCGAAKAFPGAKGVSDDTGTRLSGVRSGCPLIYSENGARPRSTEEPGS